MPAPPESRGTVRHYLAIFNQIYDSNLKGDMELTVGLVDITTAWHAVCVKEAWTNQRENKKRNIIIEHLKFSGFDDSIKELGEMEKSIRDLNLVAPSVSTPVRPLGMQFVEEKEDLEGGNVGQDDTKAKTS
jgi:hypothetical protein